MRYAAALLTLILGVSSATADDNVPPDAVFQTTPADSDGRIGGPSPLTVEFNLCRSRDADPGDDLKYSYDFEGDGGLDYFGHCRQSFTYRSDRSVPSCFWQPIVCVWDRVPFPGHQICRQYDVCVDGAGPGPQERIAFSRATGGAGSEIFTIAPDGSGLTRLGGVAASGIVAGLMPAWSPEGGRIALAAHGNIYVVGADGANPVLVTGLDQWFPSWTPDGAWVVSTNDASMQIILGRPDGSGLHPLSVPGFCAQSARFSPDGTRVAFGGFRQTPGSLFLCQPPYAESGLYVMASDGTGASLLFPDQTAGRPAWSPDGSRIAFVSRRDGNTEIYVANADGTGVQRLTTDPAFDSEPAWSPDGRHIAFQTDRDGNREIYVMNADGTGLSNVTQSPTDDSSPSWTAVH